MLTHRRYDVANALFQQPLTPTNIEHPLPKKQRTEYEGNSIGARLELEAYSTVDALATDLHEAVKNLKKELTGSVHSNEIEKVEQTLAQYSAGSSPGPRSPKVAAVPSAGQVLTVRSNVEGGGVRQLFSGLRVLPSSDKKVEDIDVRKLPNGFEVTEGTILDAGQLAASKIARTFGDVFAQQRNIRPLEKPTTTTGTQSTKLVYKKPFEDTASRNKDDYRAAHVTAGTWLTYPASETDFDVRPGTRPKITDDYDALFNKAFSSFAPSEDNTMAIIPRSDRSRLWYQRHGLRALDRIIPQTSLINVQESMEYPEIGEDFQDVIDSFEPIGLEDAQSESTSLNEEETNVLEEISELLQTLASQQRIRLRDYQNNADRGISNEPDEKEFDTFELLRKQLQVLVASLPPFAVTKLDGEQLSELNISPVILMHTPDVAGTSQPDEGTLQKQRIAIAQQAALNRPAPAPVRNSYTASTPAPSYNPQARTYNSTTNQTPSMPGYAQRNAQSYNTPRPTTAASYQTPAYSRPQQPYPGATIQQYQRIQNGVPQNTPQPNRVASPAKPVTNGHTYPARPSAAELLRNYGSNNSNATIQQIKTGQSQPGGTQGSQSSYAHNAQVQRQASGTPQPQNYTQSQTQQAANAATVAAAGQLNGIAAQRPSATPQPSTGIAQA